ncbi:MAG: RNA methyltransferase [Saprospiraceae bacterium]|nr:RNA methyltransferase [Saprospiraceae bacterium]
MISKNKIKYIRSLHSKKYRQKYNKFIVEGDKICTEFLQQDVYQLDELYATSTWLEQNYTRIRSVEERCFEVEDHPLKQISALKTANQVLIVADLPEGQSKDLQDIHQWCLYLDGIQDPGNMGTILRIADWFGVEHVFCAPDSVEIYNPKVIQASMGAFLRVTHSYIELSNLVNEWPEIPIVGAVMDGNNIYDFEPVKPGIIVIGNEGNGIRPEHLPLLKEQLTIPSARNSGAESLNAGVATGIMCALLCK